MTISHKALIVTGAVLVAGAVTTGAHALSGQISTKGNVHGPQALTVDFQKADNPVITANPQGPTVGAEQLQPAVAPIQQ